MKTKNESQFNCHHFNMAGFKKTSVELIITLLLILFYSIPLLAQSQNESYPIMEKRQFLSNLRTSEQTSRVTYSNAKHIEDLLSKVQPSIYFNSGTVKTYGEKPVSLFTNVQSLSRLNGASMLRNNIEMATVKIESPSDLNAVIDLNLFTEFKNLKYIQILSTIPTTEQAINNMVRNNEGKYSVFFIIKNGDSEQ